MTLQFVLNDDDVIDEVIRRMKELEEDTEENRVRVLLSMALEGYPITVMQTNRTPDEIVADYAKHGDVLYIKSEEENDQTIN